MLTLRSVSYSTDAPASNPNKVCEFEFNSLSNRAATENPFLKATSAPTEASRESCTGTAPMMVKPDPGSDWNAIPFWVALASALFLTFGTLFGGWRVVRTLGKRIYRIRSLDGLVSQSASGTIVLIASLAGAPVSTTDVVAPAVVGVGSGERWRHVRWAVVGEIGLAWLVTLPVSGALGAVFFLVWRWLG